MREEIEHEGGFFVVEGRIVVFEGKDVFREMGKVGLVAPSWRYPPMDHVEEGCWGRSFWQSPLPSPLEIRIRLHGHFLWFCCRSLFLFRSLCSRNG